MYINHDRGKKLALQRPKTPTPNSTRKPAPINCEWEYLPPPHPKTKNGNTAPPSPKQKQTPPPPPQKYKNKPKTTPPPPPTKKETTKLLVRFHGQPPRPPGSFGLRSPGFFGFAFEFPGPWSMQPWRRHGTPCPRVTCSRRKATYAPWGLGGREGRGMEPNKPLLSP